MASASRDRVTIDLRGIGPSVRAAAGARRLRVAAYARLALAEASNQPVAPSLPTLPIERAGAVMKVTLRLDPLDAELLLLSAAQVGLSYGAFVARLLRGIPLPAPLVARVKDRDALIVSSDHLATLSAWSRCAGTSSWPLVWFPETEVNHERPACGRRCARRVGRAPVLPGQPSRDTGDAGTPSALACALPCHTST